MNEITMNSSNSDEKVKKKVNFTRILIIFISVSAIIFIAFSIVIFMLSSKIKDISDRLVLSENYIAVQNNKVYEYASPDDVISIDDITYGDTFIKLLDNVPLNQLNYDNLDFSDGRYSYTVNGEDAYFTGIDVSYHQEDIDWEAVAADGIDFVIVRLGFRGYETGLINPDILAEKHIQGALDAGLDVGAYFYSQAITTEEAEAEAEFVIEKLKNYKITYPVIFDWEIVNAESARTNDISSEMLNKVAVAFCDKISDAGYSPMIYSNLMLALTKYDMSKLHNYDFWYVEYEHGYNPPDFPYEIDMWQYASDGSVNGINGDVDLNISFTDYPLKFKATHLDLD